MSPGDIILLDSALPFTRRYIGRSSTIVTYLPAEEVLAGSGLHRVPPLKIHRQTEFMSGIVGPVLSTVAREMPQPGGSEGSFARRLLIESARGLIASQRPINNEAGLPDVGVRDFIDAHLSNPDLSPAVIAAGCHISIRRLHRIFANTQWSVCSWLRVQRLQKCHMDLADVGLNHVSITEIAFRWGFSDSSHFSKAFKEHFGMTPSDVRRRASKRFVSSSFVDFYRAMPRSN